MVARGQGWNEGPAAEGQLKRMHRGIGTALCSLGGWWSQGSMCVFTINKKEQSECTGYQALFQVLRTSQILGC